jgi:hypothetical protein
VQLEFEARKDASVIFRTVLQEQQRQEGSTATPAPAPADPAVKAFSVDFLCEDYDNDRTPGALFVKNMTTTTRYVPF